MNLLLGQLVIFNMRFEQLLRELKMRLWLHISRIHQLRLCFARLNWLLLLWCVLSSILISIRLFFRVISFDSSCLRCSQRMVHTSTGPRYKSHWCDVTARRRTASVLIFCLFLRSSRGVFNVAVERSRVTSAYCYVNSCLHFTFWFVCLPVWFTYRVFKDKVTDKFSEISSIYQI